MPTISRSSPRASWCAPRRPKERVTLLDDKEYALDPDFMVIADASGAIGLAGIMGGRAPPSAMPPPMCCSRPRISRPTPWRDARGGSGLSPMPRSASSAASIRACRRSPSSGQRRCSWKSRAASRAVQVTPREGRPRRHDRIGWPCAASRVDPIARRSVPDDEVHAVLSAISDRVEAESGGWRVRSPPHRFDIRIEADLIEEVARLRGFDSIARESMRSRRRSPGSQPSRSVPNERL